MAPTAASRPRGRPRKSDSLTTSAASSRPPSTRRSALANTKVEPSSLSQAISFAKQSIADGSNVDVPATSMLGGLVSKAAKGKGRKSLASVSTTNDEGSDYSTPATSAIATPAERPKRASARRGRSSAAIVVAETTPVVNAIARAKALRNSEFSLVSTSQKRKRVIEDSDDEEDMEESSADAKLARTLQEEENKVSMRQPTGPAKKRQKRIIQDSEDENMEDNSADAQLALMLQEQENAAARRTDRRALPTRSTPRKIKKAPPKDGFLSDFEDDDEDEKFMMANDVSPSKSNFKVEIGATGSNTVSFTSRTTRTSRKVILDSDDTEEFLDSDEPMEEEVYSPVSKSPEQGYSKSRRKSAPAPKLSTSKYFKTTTAPSSVPSKMSRLKAHLASAIKASTRTLQTQDTKASSSFALTTLGATPVASDSEFDSDFGFVSSNESDSSLSDVPINVENNDEAPPARRQRARPMSRRQRREAADAAIPGHGTRRSRQERQRLVHHHPELLTMWDDLENLPKIKDVEFEQPKNINRELKPFQLQGVAWMREMEKTDWGGGLLGDEMGMGKTIQAVTLIMSDWPAKQPSLVLIPPVALMQWQQEIAAYTDGTLKTFVYHGTNAKTKGVSAAELKKYDVILMSYNSLESMYRKQEKGFKRKVGVVKEKSVIHGLHFHRVILDEAHNIKQRTTGCAKACFALKADHKWCLSGTPLQNRIGEFFSLIRFLDIRPFAGYFCKQCPCSTMNWEMGGDNRCTTCHHSGMQHVSVFNQELLNPIQKYGNNGPGKDAFKKLRILTDRFMLRRVKRDHSSAMELPAKEIYVNRQFFGEVENDFAGSIMNNGTRKFETYVAQGVLLNNYANIFGLIMQMRQVADHPDLILKKNSEGGQNVLVCCICDDTAEEAIRSTCHHDFCRECAKNYLHSSENPDCPQCHIPLSIDLEQEERQQDEQMVKKSSIINRIKMENWTSSSKIEALVHDLHQLRSKNMSHKSIIFSQFTTMLQLVEWRLRRAGITTVMLDGSMTPAQRQASINHFMTNVNVECFLVSLKAGGVALNLTEASKVFIIDPWWNPAAEWQSADRCHRIGQGRPCSITRLCIEDSVESRMVLLQEKKANMINSTINADESAMESLTPEDMQFLFRGT